MLQPPSPAAQNLDSHGQDATPYEIAGQTYGDVLALTGREFWQAQQAQVVFSHRVQLRYSSLALKIGKDWRIQYDGGLLNVEVPARDVDGRKRMLEVMCRELVAR